MRAQAICASTSFIGSARQKRRMPLRASTRKASSMNSGLAVSQAMKRKPVDMNCSGVFGVACGHEPDALPRIFLLVAHRHAHVGRGREVDGLEADAIHHRCDGERAGGVDAGGAPQALVAVAQAGLDELRYQPLTFTSSAPESPCRRRPRMKSGSSSRERWKTTFVFTPSMRVASSAAPRRCKAASRVGAVGDHLAQQRIVERRHPRAGRRCGYPRGCPRPRARLRVVTRPGRGHEVVLRDLRH